MVMSCVRGCFQGKGESVDEMPLFLDQEIKLLLLGTGESGKSTTARQLQIIYLNQLNEQIGLMGKLLQQNLIHGMQILIKGATGFFKEELDVLNAERGRNFMLVSDKSPLTPELVADIKDLWEDPTIKSTLFRSHRLQLPYSMHYLMENIDRITSPDFKPTNEDVLMSRARTTGIIETVFEVEGTRFRVMDVGGQRSERRKWIHCFDNVTAIIFCVALNEFDENLYEDTSVNRMQESMALFEEISNNKAMENTPIVIFFNKSDLLKKKLEEGHDIRTLFPEYTGAPDFDSVVNFIESQYVNTCRVPYKTLYSYVTCAHDTKSIKAVFEVTSRILKKRQQEAAASSSKP